MLNGFAPYVEDLEMLAGSKAPVTNLLVLKPHLDGAAGRRLRDSVRIEFLRELGAFFTGESLARKLIALVPENRSRIIDPACGCGDLLLAASARLPVLRSLEQTLELWNTRLVGRDQVPLFVRASKARLVLAAKSRGANSAFAGDHPAALLTNISLGDGLEIRPASDDAVVLNPPYGRVPAPSDCSWANGKTTEAAIFLDYIVDACQVGTSITSVLPEVLRAGSRYERFRQTIETRLRISTIAPAGVFDALTDVDVFLLSGEVTNDISPGTTEWVPRLDGPQLGEICSVSVGSLVAYRDPHLGPWRAYLAAENRGNRATVIPEQRRRFRGKVVDPPFVVISRTNRPNSGNSPRLSATTVLGDRPVAVENHLLVLEPHDRTRRGCKSIADLVQSVEASRFLNARLRCRHLTVSAIREIPR